MKMTLSRTDKRRTSIMRQKFVATHTLRQTEIPALLESWVTNTLFVKIPCPQKNCFSIIAYFRKTQICLNIGLLMICLVFCSLAEVCVVVRTNCCFTCDLFKTNHPQVKSRNNASSIAH